MLMSVLKKHGEIISISLFWAAMLSVCVINLGHTAESATKKEAHANTKNRIASQQEKILQDFIGTAFSNAVWETPGGGLCSSNCEEIEHIEKKYPFLTLANQSLDGLPKRNVINKWSEKKILVGLGWPESQMQLGRAAISGKQKSLKQIEPLIIEEIKKINSLNLVELDYLPPDKEQDNPAKIRIDPFSVSDPAVFTKLPYSEYMDPWSGTIMFDSYVRHGVRFTTGQQFNVDGYFVPNKNNDIVMAVCHPNTSLPKEALSSHIRECLFRSLGLPEVSKVSNGILGQRKRYTDDLIITDYDSDLLKTLYSDQIKSGDTLNDIARFFDKN